MPIVLENPEVAESKVFIDIAKVATALAERNRAAMGTKKRSQN